MCLSPHLIHVFIQSILSKKPAKPTINKSKISVLLFLLLEAIRVAVIFLRLASMMSSVSVFLAISSYPSTKKGFYHQQIGF